MIRTRQSKRFRTRTWIGRASRRRIQGGGPLALGRPSASKDTWREIRAQVLARARWVCQACGVRTRLEVHHVVKRAQGGSDFDLDHLVALCRHCHVQTDAPYRRGRLVITPRGAGRFTFAVMQAPDKWAMRQRTAANGGPPNDHSAEPPLATMAPTTRNAMGASVRVPGDEPPRGDHP